MKRADLVNEAVKLLDQGVLLSALPDRLMRRYDLTPGVARGISQAALNKKAREIAQAALTKRQERKRKGNGDDQAKS